MTDRGIIFSGTMVRALWEGRKSQTRRVLHPQPPTDERFAGSSFALERRVADEVGIYSLNEVDRLPKHPTKWDLCGSVGVARDAGFPTVYDAGYAAGDRLWVREAHYLTDDGHSELAVYVVDEDAVREHMAALDDLARGLPAGTLARHRKLRPSIHLPRWASRLTLTVTDVRVQRLWDISDEDALAEGVWNTRAPGGTLSWTPPIHPDAMNAPRRFYVDLWETLHGVGSWTDNPWVVVPTFTVERRNIDAPATREAAVA